MVVGYEDCSSVVMKALSSVWRGLTPSDKLHYERLSMEESKKYFEKIKCRVKRYQNITRSVIK